MSSLLDHARLYQNYYNTLTRNSLFKKLAKDKAYFKDLIQQYIDAGGLKETITGLKAKSFNREGEERITKKIDQIYENHEIESVSGNLVQLAVDIQKSAAVLVKAYEKMDEATFVTPEGITINHRDFREAKERLANDITTVGPAAARKELTAGGIAEKIMANVGLKR